ncbi:MULTISPECIES: glycosyltransferase [Chryseobacterium]|uniref:Glycosyltransferase involved in cell wall biosynthesis n=1 Tax=Chryseobacterium camelliae TaxID=1265445 RepID=A0ABU0TFS9_9FLAO|nr:MULTISPECIES: glycosyltransferase [Chryseobacterium]MDT3407088.1 glycosyltransferase involved in cell wall biosynthesis [Pseudacidovorax intermedius]MDQ1095120.1 glycosyltransferase involved in cell wall biosynthesis [Chryseobacterium camelliae]MDQ1099058.1 glycosyltransferase involved in cell wall biosynthesis [Chryseobacterium sp. SORGH_AS_1048]MDR6086407.1 glycosyltransferase involved in cell wall biosynthesis [Chryseobacterium sp. SORGH_AS_0909]MDR6130779.1 glycosyltransferase involved 
MLLSYIIPVYNSAAFLEDCLNSIVEQNLDSKEFEIIVVNDGSTDNSDEVLQTWKSRNGDIQLAYFYQKNKGQGAARNLAIKESRGEFLWFIDSDDFIEKNIVKVILDEIRKDDLDAIWFDHRLVDENGVVLPKPSIDIKKNNSSDIYSGEVFFKEVFNTSCMPWAFIFKRKILIDNNLDFHEGIYFEDIVFTPKLIYFSKRIKFFNVLAYNYVIHNNSTMRSSDKFVKRCLDSIIVVRELQNFSEKQNSKLLETYIEDFSSEILMYNYRLVISQNNPAFFKEFKNEMIKNNLYPFKIKRPYQLAFLSKIANISPYIFKKLCQLRPIK